MQNTTSHQPSNHNTIPKHVKIVLNTGFTFMSEQSQLLKPEYLPWKRNILNREEVLLNLPFAQIKYQSRRRGSFLECAFSYKNAQIYACAVSSQGLNRQFWDELVANYSSLQKANAVLGCSGKTLKAPEHSPWIATFVYSAIVLMKEPEQVQLFTLMNDLAVIFLVDSATSSGADSNSGSR